MNARGAIASKLWLDVPSTDDDQAKRIAERMLDAYRDEILAEVAVTVRAAAPKYLDNEVDEHTFQVLNDLAAKIVRGDL